MKKPAYIFSNGELKRQQNTLRFDGPKGMRMLPVETTSEIHIFGECELNTRMLNFLTRGYSFYTAIAAKKKLCLSR